MHYMKMLSKLLGIALLMIVLSHCEKEDTSFDWSKQRILFQYEYVNYAWGFQHQGWLIDSCGKVYCYNIPHNWTFCDNDGFITDSPMNVNVSATDSICKQVDIAELRSMAALIGPASNGKISTPVHEMCDAGGVSSVAFVYDSQNKQYKRVLLRQWGDFSSQNQSDAGRILANWLENVNLMDEQSTSIIL
jgi:hypothetical protein